MIYIILIIGGLYTFVIASFFYGWLRLKTFNKNSCSKFLKVSILIPMRNEERNVANLLHALINQSYPQNSIEIIIINDHSTDRSINVLSNFTSQNIQLLHLPSEKSGKKAALLSGLEASTGDILISTDADCIPNNFWIESIVNYFQKYQPLLLMAPVIGLKENSIFNTFQRLELYSLQGSTAGSAAIGHPIMCNGANLSYSKEILNDIKEIYNEKFIPSGDDIFVMQAIKKKYPGKIHYLKSMHASVSTKLENSIKGFFNQRKRWTAKARYYKDSDTIFAAITVLAVNILLLILMLAGIIKDTFNYFMLAFSIKSTIDFLFLFSITSFFKVKKLLFWFPLVQCFYFLYVSITFFGSLTFGFTWKSRTFKS